MRKIKLRLWDQNQETMLYAYEPTEQGKREYYPFCFGIGFSHYDKKDLIIEEWTGLVDKNDVEIYEGDIMKFAGIVESTEEIAWDDGCFVQKVKGNPEHKIVDKNTIRGEVIGNIHENEGLLND